MKTTTRTEGILPALETAHAVAALPKLLAGIGDEPAAWPGRGADARRVLRSRRQGPGRAGAIRRRRAVGGRAVTIDELRALCLGLPGTHEKETWGDAEHAGDVTFRVRDKIYLITGQDGGSASVRTDIAQQADLLAAFPDAIRSAPYVGRFGWVSVTLDALDPAIVDGHRHRCVAADGAEGRRRGIRRGPTVTPVAMDPRRGVRHQRHDRGASDRRRLRPGSSRRARGPDPVHRRRLSGRGDEPDDRARRRRCRRGPPRGRPPVLGPARRRCHAPAGIAASRSALGPRWRARSA